MKNKWYVYMVECNDGSYYTGITVDLDRRVNEHNNSPKGSKYTKARRPVKLVYYENVNDRSLASKLEAAWKKYPRNMKTAMIDFFNKRKQEDEKL